MELSIHTLGEVTHCVFVICPDKFGLHKYSADKVYVRYLILTGLNLHAIFIDDPSYDDCQRMTKLLPKGTKFGTTLSECPWCQAKTQKKSSS